MKYLLRCILLTFFSFTQLMADENTTENTGREIVQHCAYKYPGSDQRSTFSVLLKDSADNKKKSVYSRLWKDFKGVDGIADKMILFTTYPPDAKGTAFMRAGYIASENKDAEQWIYLPNLGKIRRVSIRDPGDSFLNSDLSYEDVSDRALDDDEHRFIEEKTVEDETYYVVESLPIKKSIYKKRVRWFTKTPDWENCVNTRTIYYDGRGDLLKVQELKWQQVGRAWVWDKVMVTNKQTSHVSMFKVSDVVINTGLEDRLFSKRTLRLGESSVPEYK